VGGRLRGGKGSILVGAVRGESRRQGWKEMVTEVGHGGPVCWGMYACVYNFCPHLVINHLALGPSLDLHLWFL
jgi:hypothetical protein